MSDVIIEALYAYGEARAVRLTALRTRNGHRCAEAYRGSNEPDDPGVAPCYLDGSGRDWCDPCRAREQHEPALRAAVRAELLAKRRLHYHLDRTIAKRANAAE